MIHQPLELFKRIVVTLLTVLMGLTIAFIVIDLAWLLVKDILTPPTFLLDVDKLLDIFGLFMLVLIGLELMDTMRMYQTEHVIHVEIVFLVALIALARKVIILDMKEAGAMMVFALGALIVALAGGYFLFKRSVR